MSEKCKRHFIQDLCFYECEPHIKPWVVQVNRSFARQRIFKVPLCASDCQTWWNDCKEEYTCSKNWPKDFKWINGSNHCKKDSECKKFHQIYDNAAEFCENVWDHSWQYTSDDMPCMKIWFDSKHGNPNKAIAEYYASINQASALNLYDFNIKLTIITSILIFFSIHLNLFT